MAGAPRLNGVIRQLETGGIAFGAFAPVDVQTAVAMAASRYDGVVFEAEHLPWDALELRNALQFMLDPRRIAAAGSVAPAVTPLCRIPVNGAEKAQWQAKQALDLGVYGIVWPHVSTVEEAYNAVAACRYPRLPGKPRHEPRGVRGDGPARAARYWGLAQQEYYGRADVWPLDPAGEILVVIQIEDVAGVENLPRMLDEVPGVGAVLIGEGDLGQELGFPRQYDHPDLLDAIARIADACRDRGVVCGHPHADAANMERLLAQGFRLLLAAPRPSYENLEAGLALAGRS